MGRWGDGPFESDLAADVRADLLTMIDAGNTPSAALKLMAVRYGDALAETETGDEYWAAVLFTLDDLGQRRPASTPTGHQADQHRHFTPNDVYDYHVRSGDWHALLLVIGTTTTPRWNSVPLIAVLDWKGDHRWSAATAPSLQEVAVKPARRRWAPADYDLTTGAFPGTVAFGVAPGDSGDCAVERLTLVGRRHEVPMEAATGKRMWAWWDMLDPYLNYLWEAP